MAHLPTQFSENVVATAVDMLSISVAYQLGINQSGLLVGFLYAVLDAYLVIWQRQRFTRLMRLIISRLTRLPKLKQAKNAVLRLVQHSASL